MNGNDTFLDVNNAHLRVTSGNVYASAFNLDQIDIVMSSNTASTVNFNNPTKAFNAASNIEVGTANLFVDTVNSRVGVGTASPATTLDVAGDLNVSGNLTIIGTRTTLDTEHLMVKDPIIELGKGNTTSPIVDLGLILTRPATTSNVGIIFDESESTLEIGYTQGNASDSTITMQSAATEPLSVNVNGTISGNGSGLTALNATNITTGTLDRNTTGSAATLTTPRSIGGVNFDGSADIVPTTFGAATFDTDTLVVDSVNNRVGVGTTSPQAPLHIGDYTSGSAGELLRLSGASSADRHFKFLNEDDGVIGGAGANAIWVHDINSSFGQYAFRTNNNELMRITNSGNVGIGTTEPLSKLDIYNPGGAELIVSRKAGSSVNPTIRLWNFDDNNYNNHNAGTSVGTINFSGNERLTGDTHTDDSRAFSYANTLYDWARISALFVGSSDSAATTQGYVRGDLAFYTNNGDGATSDLQERMRIKHNGNVGIGTTSPTAKLEVHNSGAAAGIGDLVADFTGSWIRIGDARSSRTFSGGSGVKFHDTGVAHYSVGQLDGKFKISVSSGDGNSLFPSGYTEGITINTNGIVTTPSRPAFYAWDNSTSRSGTTLTFNSTTYNIGSHYNTSTSRFKTPVAGTYIFAAVLAHDTANEFGDAYFSFYVDGVLRRDILEGMPIHDSHYETHAVYIVNLSANQYVDIRSRSNTNITFINGNHGAYYRNCFQGALLG